MPPAPRDPRRALRPAPHAGDVVSRPPARRHQPDELDEGPSPEDLERFGGVTRTCPSCGQEIFDDVDLCYHCGHALSARTTKGPPRWAIITAALVVAAFVAAYLFR